MRIFCAATFAEVFDLHDFGKCGYVNVGLGSFCKIVPFEDFFILQNVINSMRNNVDDPPGERHPYASISEGTFAGLLAFLREISGLFPDPL